MKQLTKIREWFFWGKGEKHLFRMQLSGHALARIKERHEQTEERPIDILRRLARCLEKTDLTQVRFPQERDDYIIFFDETREVLFTTFLPVVEDPSRKQNPEWIMVIESYLIQNKKFLIPIAVPKSSRWADKTVCMVVYEDGSVITGQHNDYFL